MIDRRGPSAWATLGTQCCQSCWQAPPITSRSPWPTDQRLRRAPPPRGRTWNGSGCTDAEDGHHGILVLEPFAVAVPGDRVAPVAVQVEADGVERLGVVLGEHPTGLGQHREGLDVLGEVAPPAGEPRLGELAVVHDHLASTPRQAVDEVVEHLLRADEPCRAVVDPRGVVQPGAPQLGELAVDRGQSTVEQRGLPGLPRRVRRPCRPGLGAPRAPWSNSCFESVGSNARSQARSEPGLARR